MKKWLFIINPISGNAKGKAVEPIVRSHPAYANDHLEFRYTSKAGEGAEWAQQMATQVDYIIAVGGDGTVNEVGGALVGFDGAAFGIIPTGSGNGLARHLGVPMRMKHAIDWLRQARVAKMDTGLINGQVFLCVCGTGFDALVAHRFAEANGRGFRNYFKVVRKELFAYQGEKVLVKMPEENIATNVFMLSVANGPQFGNEIYINPLANAFDQKLNLTLLKPFSKRKLFSVLTAMRRKRTHQLKNFTQWEGNEFVFSTQSGMIHVDGEPRLITGEIRIQLQKASLSVLTKA